MLFINQRHDRLNSLSAIAITPLLALAAFLSATVGHAGGSSYLAVLAFFNAPPAVMKPAALMLNIMVATIGTIKFYRAGCFSWRIFWPFAITSIPFSFIGGSLPLPAAIYRPIVGVILLFSAWRLFATAHHQYKEPDSSVPVWQAALWGILLGLLSGVTGVGGGIFLSPLLLLMGWATPRVTSGLASAFILVNSIAGLLGHLSAGEQVPQYLWLWAPAAAIGGFIGAELGSRKLGNATIRKLLAVVLVIAGGKLMLH